MRFGVLGPLAVWTDEGTPVAVRDTKVRALLADLLAHAGQPVPAGRLIEDLWGERPPRNPAGTLQARVSQLRGALAAAGPGGRELLVRRPAGYVLRVPRQAVDAHRFEDLAAEAARAGEPGARAALLGEALSLWRGPAYADFADHAFARTAVAGLEERRLAAFEARAEARWELGEHEALAAELAGPVAAHPLRERLRAVHLRALYRSGRTREALAGYEELRAALAGELGADPGPELRELHRAMLAQDPALAAGPRTNLPASLGELIGRGADLGAAAGLLAAARLVTLTGPGGVGKTRLALATAERVAGAFPGGVWLVELAGAEARAAGGGTDGVTAAVAAVLGVREDVGPGAAPAAGPPAWQRVAEALAGRRALLVLDNCEHVAEAAARLVGRLLRAAPELRVLATSREPLGLTGEHLRAVEPLELPPPGAPAAEAFAAVRLFVARAAAASGGAFALEPGNAAEVAAVCRRLDGIPLALELAAARVRALGVRELAARLDDRFRVLAAGPRDAPERQRTLRAVLDWSWDLLTGPERALLRRLSVHAGGWALPAAEALGAGEEPGPAEGPCGPGAADAPDAVAVLARLVDRSLVVAGPEGRYRLLESVAAYGLERLREAGEEEAARSRHAAFHLALAERAAPLLRGPEQRPWLERLDAEAGNLGGALEWALAAKDAGYALRLVNALAWYWFLRGRLGEARCSFEAALALPGPVDARRAAATAWHAGLTATAAGAAGAGREEEVLALYGPGGVDDPPGLARARWFLSLTRWAFGDHRAHEAWVDRALAAFRALGDTWGTAAALATRARLAVGRADFAGMERDGRASLDLFERLGDAWGRLEAGYALGVVAEVRGDYEAAADVLREGLRLAEGLGMWTEASFRLSGLGRIALLTGDLERSRELHQRAARLAAEHSDRPAEEFADIGLALVARRQGRPDEAEALLRKWLDWLRGVEGTGGLAFVTAQLGFVAEQRGDAAGALRLQREAYEAARRTGDPRALALALEGLAGARALSGRPAHAARLLGAAESLRRGVGAPLPPGERHDVARVEEAARAALGREAFEAERARGAGLAPEAAASVWIPD
ncbi:BTAD domain-containing putative transcriptional regulator [Streptomyces sp. DSM 44917]|uniref:BTAD domain-containing putative transcriptional regulator n=1 Tax=Streptomyces boetiae TaxID=3075541 RepID=A0ABU2L503_9ACTN|nr:BTAD domain-containing putative transcriptional regulator [Streptomyces sp. DSM 44917]MDT0306640.1 BTAD domain-containing putative transcriptional regulator [Streptomyces sp. DSM 44917]